MPKTEILKLPWLVRIFLSLIGVPPWLVEALPYIIEFIKLIIGALTKDERDDVLQVLQTAAATSRREKDGTALVLAILETANKLQASGKLKVK